MVDYGSSSRDHLEGQSESTVHLLESAHSTDITSRKSPTKSSWSIITASTFSVICVVFAMAFLLSGKKTDSAALVSSSSFSSKSKSFSITATNEYGQYNGSSYPWMSEIEGTRLVEPYKVTLLKLTGTVTLKDYNYTWTIVNDNGLKATDDYVIIDTLANKQSVQFLNTGIYTLKVKLLDSTGSTKYSYSTRMVCK